MYSYAYLIGCSILFVLFWVPLYLKLGPQESRGMLLLSALSAPLGPLTVLFFWHDYWSPLYAFSLLAGLEEFMFSFIIGGIGGGAYQAFIGGPVPVLTLTHKRLWAFGLAGVSLTMFYVGTFVLGVNSLYVSLCIMAFLTTCELMYAPQLWPRAVAGALCTAGAMFVMYQIWFLIFPSALSFWNTSALTGVYVQLVPLEELLWGALWGAFAGPAYVFVSMSRYVRAWYKNIAHCNEKGDVR